MSLILALVIVTTAGTASADEEFVAATFARASEYILLPDFVHSAVANEFTAAELSVLSEQRTRLTLMVNDGLRRVDGVGGALMTAHFKLDADIALLRLKLFSPGRAYGWEGPDYDSEEDHLTDSQFVYHSRYLDAIEAASGQPIYEAVRPTDMEIQELLRLMTDPSGAHYYWAKWLARKLRLVPPTG